MNYKLAKKIKDAGFPQHRKDDGDDSVLIKGCGALLIINGRRYKQNCYIPPLSELIDECLKIVPDLLKLEFRDNLWSADTNWELEIGKSPEEAVAKLWLELNKKKLK